MQESLDGGHAVCLVQQWPTLLDQCGESSGPLWGKAGDLVEHVNSAAWVLARDKLLSGRGVLPPSASP